MSSSETEATDFEFLGQTVALGERKLFQLPVSESYSGLLVSIPVQVWRGSRPGPTVFISGALHGDEVNGTGVVRSLILDPPFELASGSLLLCPVINILGLERHSRYLPDRRDLNRCFPGSPQGTLSSRYAAHVFSAIVGRSDFGIDLHTGAIRRTNYPNVRGDLGDPAVARLARAFGCEIIVNSTGPEGSLRRAACAAGCPTIILEAGEVLKIEPSYVEVARRGIKNVLIDLEMVRGRRSPPPYQAEVDRTRWLRSESGGLLQFHVAPGDAVNEGQALATCSNLVGVEQGVLRSPAPGVVLGMTTLPAVKPGDPVCHLAIVADGVESIRKALKSKRGESHDRVRDEIATSLTISEAPPALG